MKAIKLGSRGIVLILTGLLITGFQNCSGVGSSAKSDPAPDNVPQEVEVIPPEDDLEPVAAEKTFPPTGISDYDFEHDSYQRSSLVYTPVIADSTQSLPLYVVLHGGGGNSEKARSNVNNGFERLADQRQVVVVYPEALIEAGARGGHWNDGRDIDGYIGHDVNIDDTKYIVQLIELLKSQYSGIDGSQVYLIGASNGGMMTQRVACEKPEGFAGFVSVMAALPKNIEANCKGKLEKPFLFINGTEDPLMRYDEEFVYHPNGQPILGERLTVPDSVLHWTNNLSCSKSAKISDLLDLDTEDSSTVAEYDYNCSGNAKFRFLKVTGGGHTWPGNSGSILPTGPVNNDMESTTAIWRFFKNRPTTDDQVPRDDSTTEITPADFKPCEHQNGNTYQCATISYGDHSRQNYDLWLPNTPKASGDTPLVIYIHGGGYYQGDKSSAYRRTNRTGRYLEEGYAFATISYRLSGDSAYEKGVTGEYPVQMRDGASALQDLRMRSQTHGYSADQIALTGTSAGGGIAMWMAFHDDLKDTLSTNPRDHYSTRVPCLALSDTQPTLTVKEIGEILKIPNFVPDMGISQFYGFTSEQYEANPEYYDERYAESMQEASPISHLSTDDNQIKVHLSYLMDYNTQDIHSPEFGDHLINGEPASLLAKYNRISLKDLGNITELKVNQGSVTTNAQNIFGFINQTCF